MGNEREDRYKLEIIDISDDTQVNAAADITNQLKPPVGFIYEIVQVYISIPDPVGSAAGTHTLACTSFGMGGPAFTGTATTGNVIRYRWWALAADSSEAPSGATQQADILMSNIYASNSIPLDLKYTNSTDVNQTGTRTMEFLVKKYREAI